MGSRATFPFTMRLFAGATVASPLTINTSGGGSSNPFPLMDVSIEEARPRQLKTIEKVVLRFTAPVTLGQAPVAAIVLSYFNRDGQQIEVQRVQSGTGVTDIVITPPNTGGLLGSAEFPILEAEGVGLDGAILDVVEVYLGLDR